MKKIGILAGILFAASPAYGIGFWGEFGGGMDRFSHGDVNVKSEMDGNTSEATFNYSGGAALMGGNFAGGVSLSPVPFLIGVGIGYYVGSGSSKGTIGDAEVTSDWDMTQLNFRIPVAYKMSFTAVQVLLGVAPGFNSVTFKDTLGNDEKSYSGMSFGAFGKGYFMLGAFGIGGGVSLDFIPGLSSTEETTVMGNTITTTTTFKGNTNFTFNIGVFFLSGLLE